MFFLGITITDHVACLRCLCHKEGNSFQKGTKILKRRMLPLYPLQLLSCLIIFSIDYGFARFQRSNDSSDGCANTVQVYYFFIERESISLI